MTYMTYIMTYILSRLGGYGCVFHVFFRQKFMCFSDRKSCVFQTHSCVFQTEIHAFFRHIHVFFRQKFMRFSDTFMCFSDRNSCLFQTEIHVFFGQKFICFLDRNEENPIIFIVQVRKLQRHLRNHYDNKSN